MQIKARGRDVLWNYGGLFFRMAGQFFVLPLVLSLLDSEYVGLWYVFTAVSGFIVLFQAGFDPTFARNVAYCWSGARSFSKNGYFWKNKRSDSSGGDGRKRNPNEVRVHRECGFTIGRR